MGDDDYQGCWRHNWNSGYSIYSQSQKSPPLGIMPNYIWVERRLGELIDAIKRYSDENIPIPTEWFEECLEHQLFLQSRKTEGAQGVNSGN